MSTQANNPAPLADKIEVTRNEPGDYTVRCGDRYQDELTQDEALWCVAHWIIAPEKGTRYLRTKEEHDAWERRLRRITTEDLEEVNVQPVE